MTDLLKALTAWRIGLLVIAFIATTTIGFVFPYPNFQWLIAKGWNIPLLWTWGGFDGIHYLTIAESGYIADYTQAFFPMYPQLIRWFYLNFHLNSLIAGLVVSHLSLVIAIPLFWKLLRLDLSKTTAWSVVLLFLLFPNSFYLVSVYSESTFLVFLFGSFLAARKQRWRLAGVLGAIASATRLIGVFIFPALLVEWWTQRKSQISNLKSQKFERINSHTLSTVIPIFLVPLGLLLYMQYLGVHFNDPFKFLHAQPAFGADRSDKIILLYQVLWRYAKMMVTVNPMSILYFRVVKELFWAVLFLILGLASFKKTRLSYALFGILAYLAPTLTGTFSSMGRYVLVMFPAFMTLALWLDKHRRMKWAWYGFSAILLIANVTLFVTGRWVA